MSTDEPKPGPPDDPFDERPRHGGSGTPSDDRPSPGRPSSGGPPSGQPSPGQPRLPPPPPSQPPPPPPPGGPPPNQPPPGSPYSTSHGAPPRGGPAGPADSGPYDERGGDGPWGGAAGEPEGKGGEGPYDRSGGGPYGPSGGGPYDGSGGGPYGQGPRNPYARGPRGGGPEMMEGMPPLAPLGRRLVARIIDIVIVLIPAFVLDWAVVGVQNSDFDTGRSAVGGVFTALVGFVYEFSMTRANGQTVGKRAMGLRAAMLEDGRVPTQQSAATRALVLWLPAFCCSFVWFLAIGITVLFDRPYRQGLQDKAAKTVVVEAT